MSSNVKTETTTTDDSGAGRNLVAVIGIDQYRKWPRLSNAVNDARGALNAFLRLGFEQVAEPLYDEAATADAIRSLVTDDLMKLNKNDSLVLFFAGHGHTITQTFHEGDSVKTGYIIPVEGDVPGGSAARWLRLDNWLSDVARLAAKHILVFLDACHSGIALGSLIKWRDSNRRTESFERLGQRRSRRVITSALDDQRAMDGGPISGHSLFTGCLIDGLDGRIAPHGDLVTGSQIGLYLQERVTSYPHTDQTPDFGALEHDKRGELIIKISTDGATTRPTEVAGPTSRFGRSLAVVIGIDEYGEGISPLRTAVADAKAIADALQCDHGFETWCLFDDDAPLARLLTLLREDLPAALGPDDRVLFYFAGHGVALTGERGPTGYLVPARGRRSDRDGFLAMQILYGELARIPVRHALIILDCCFSDTLGGTSPRDVESAVAKIYRERYERYLESPAWQVLASASADPLAFDMLANDRGEGSEIHSPFARALLEGLGGAADYTRENLITTDALARFVRERVTPAAEPAGRWHLPQLFALDRHADGQFVFQVPNRDLELAPAPPLGEDANPYRGLQSFGEQDRAVFFGKEAATRRLVDEVAARQLTVVVGPSGCGKSSLVHAGAVPAIRARGWTVLATQRPGRTPLAALGALTKELRVGPEGADLTAAWLAAATERASHEPWLVIIDQLEELVTLRTEHRDRATFLDALAAALKASPSLHLLVIVRSDAESRLCNGALAPWWKPGRFVVPATTRDELRQIIEQPASAAVLHFEPQRLVERLIDDAAIVAAPLPLLSFALSELYRACWGRWRAGDHGRALRETDYDEMGSVAEALIQQATALHDGLVAEDAAYAITIRNLFLRMVVVLNGEVTRWWVPKDELVYVEPAENQRVAEVLKRFVGARLIAVGIDNTGDGGTSEYVEPIHDDLVRGWVQVGRWLEELETPAGTHALLGALAEAVRAWRAHNQADSYLWSAPRAELAERLERDRPFVFNAHESLFVQRSAHIRRNRRTRLINTLVTQRRLVACSYQEAGRRLLLEGRPFEAVPYLVEARRAGASGAPLRVLFAEASRNLTVSPFEHHGHVLSAAFSPDGARVVTTSDDKTARVWDVLTGKPLSPSLEHRDIVWGAAFSPDGARIVTASEDRTARIWDVTAGKMLCLPLEHQAAVWSAAFSPDGTRAITASEDKTARIWDAATGKAQSPPFEHKGAVRTAAFSPDGRYVVTASADQTARVWDATTGKAVSPSFKHRGPVRCAAFSPNGIRVVTASEDQTARVWDAITGKTVSPPLEHQAPVTSATFSPDGTRVVTASEDQTARVWDATTGKAVSPPLEHQGSVEGAGFSADGTCVVTASLDQTARVWDATTGRPLSPPLEHQGSVEGAMFSADGTRVVTASLDQTARVWDASTGTTRSRPLAHHGAVESAGFSPDGARVVTASGDRTARVWDATTGKPVSPPLEHHDRVSSAAFSLDGTRLVTTSNDRTARVWDATTGKPVSPPLEHRAPVSSATFNPDGTRVVTTSEDHTARVWDATTGKPVCPPLEHHSFVWSAAFSPDGTRIITASADNTARIWDATTGAPVAPPLEHRGSVRSAAFSSDGTRVVTASWDNTARVWDASTGESVSPPLKHQSIVWRAAFSPDGTRVVTASHDRAARIWDATTGKPLSRRLEHRDKVWSAAFSPDGTRVVTASSDRTARVWDAATGNPLSPPLEHRDEVWSALFSPDSTRIVTASEDRTACVWEPPLDQGTLADWTAIADRSPYVLSNGVLSLRSACPSKP